MAPVPGEFSTMNSSQALDAHAAAVTRDYISQPRLGKYISKPFIIYIFSAFNIEVDLGLMIH